MFQTIGLTGVAPNLELIQRIESIRDELLISVNPGEFEVDILPPREKEEAMAGRKLIVLQVNVAVYPLADFTPQNLSVRLTASNEEIQFEDVSLASRMDAIGSYEVGVTDSGKFTATDKESEKLAFKLDGQVAKLEGEIGDETSRSIETSTQVAVKRSAPAYAPLVVSSAVKNVARWELLRAPNQMLRGGSKFLATAFVPSELRLLPLEVRVRVDLEKYGSHEISATKQIELAPRPSTLILRS
jgi:hypothetical protein